MKLHKIKTKLTFYVPLPEDDFEQWDFSIKTPKQNNDIKIVKDIKRKKYGKRGGNTNTELF